MIQVKKLTITHKKDLQTIIEDFSFALQPGDKAAIIGEEGNGKSTLLKLIVDEALVEDYAVWEGEIIRGKDKIGYLAQELSESEKCLSVYEYCSGELAFFDLLPKELAQIAAKVGLSQDIFYSDQEVGTLSGGEKVKLQLARILMGRPDALLLDEPSNDLDVETIEWLEEYVRSFRGTVVTISHDRYFLDRIVTRVIEIADGKAEFYSGNYSFYAVEKERRFQERMKQYQKEQAKIDQLEKAAEQLRLWAFQGMDKTYRRAISMEKRIERMRTTSKPTKAKKMDARFSTAEFHGDEVLALRNLAKSYGDKHLFDGISLKIEGGERIALIGDNGTGKSTLIKMIMGELYPDDGRIRTGPQVKAAYLPQIIHFDHPDWNLVENMMAAKKGLSAQSARNRLAAYDFRGEDVMKPVSVLSGGEQSRLRLCMLMDDEINFLILDEPTNHLDIDSREWIEEAVEAYDGTLLFVSHDRYFINRFATRIWELANGTITDYPMGFAQYRQVKAQEEAERVEPPKPVKEKTITERPQRGNKAQQAARRQLTICERDIAKAEERIVQLDADMEAAACDYEKLNALVQEKDAAQAELDALYEKWEQLSEEAGD